MAVDDRNVGYWKYRAWHRFDEPRKFHGYYPANASNLWQSANPTVDVRYAPL